MSQNNQVELIDFDIKDIEKALNDIHESKGITRTQILGPGSDQLTSEATLTRIAEIKAKLNGNISSNDVSLFGAELGENTNNHTDSILKQVNNSDLEGLGNGLTDLVISTQKHSQQALQFKDRNQKSKIPVVGKYIDRYREKKQENKILFETTKESIDRMVDNLNVRQTAIMERNIELETMYKGVLNTAQEIGLYIVSAQIRLGEMKTELIALTEKNNKAPNNFLQQEIYDLNASINALDKRVDDMYLLQQASFLTLPQIRVIQQNNRDLTDKFNVVKSITIPTWKNSYAMAVSLKEQQNNIELINKVDDHTNHLLTSLADQLKQNSIATAKANNRNAIDVETIEHMQLRLTETIQEVIKIQQQGILENRKAITRLTMNRGFSDAVVNTPYASNTAQVDAKPKAMEVLEHDS